MTLRAKLILAFLFLAVVPLVVLTVYSYRSSVAALHRTVERESGVMADQMADRMELVAEDLDRRVDRLGRLPFSSLTAVDPGSERFAGEFAVGVAEEMGDSAMMLDSLEFVPATVPSSPARAPASPASLIAEAAPVVIHLSKMLFHGEEVKGLDELRRGTRVVRGEDGMVLLPEGFLGKAHIEIDMEEVVPAELFEALRQLGEEAQAGELQDIEAIARSIERKAVAFAERMEARAEVIGPEHQAPQAELVEQERLAEERQEEISREKRRQELAHWDKKRWRLNREFASTVERDGHVVGTVKARVDAKQALQTVLERAGQQPGEIPFAMDEDGNLFTLQEGDEAILRQLPLNGVGGGEAAGRVAGDWVVVVRREPSLGIAFGMARPVGESLDEIRGANVRNLGYGLGVVFVAMLGIVPLSNRMTRDLADLTAGAARLSAGDLQTEVPVRSRDEIGRLARTFNEMTSDLRRNQKQLVVQERMSKELEMSRQIQEELLPHVGASFPFAEAKGVSIPAREVGGDFFNYFPLPGGDVAIVMGDVSGKGMPAALLMANLQATLKARMPHERNLAELALGLDAEIEGNTLAGSYVTLFIGILDQESFALRYVNAGHNAQYALRADGLQRLESVGRPLGLLPGGGYAERTVELSAGDFLFLFTDGLTEAESPDGEEFGAARLESLLMEAGTESPDHLLARVEKAVSEHRAGSDAADDATMLAMKMGTPA